MKCYRLRPRPRSISGFVVKYVAATAAAFRVNMGVSTCLRLLRNAHKGHNKTRGLNDVDLRVNEGRHQHGPITHFWLYSDVSIPKCSRKSTTTSSIPNTSRFSCMPQQHSEKKASIPSTIKISTKLRFSASVPDFTTIDFYYFWNYYDCYARAARIIFKYSGVPRNYNPLFEG